MIDADLRVLHLATSREIFFEQQITTLEARGVDCTVRVVPGEDQIDGAMGSRRGLAEYLRFLPTVRRTLRRGEYDVVHANYGLTAPYAVTQLRLPVVLTLWGSDVVGLDGRVTRLFAPWADAITVRSDEMRDLLGLDAYVVPSGVDTERFRPIDRERARDRVGWSHDARHVLFPYSRDYERKNYTLAEQVVAAAADRTGIDVRLQTISGVPHAEVPYYMNAADAVILTSRHEGSPNTVKEAMACDVPVVSTDVGDVYERLAGVDPGGVGTDAAALTDHLVAVLDGDARSNGRERVMEVSWDRIGDRIVRIYRQVLGADVTVPALNE